MAAAARARRRGGRWRCRRTAWPQLVVLREQLGLDVRRRSCRARPAPARARRRSRPPPRRSAPRSALPRSSSAARDAAKPASSASSGSICSISSSSWSSSWEMRRLSARDLVLQRLQLAGVADRAAVERLVVVVGLVVERWRSRPRAAAGRGRARGACASTSAALASSAGQLAPSPRRARRGWAGAPAGGAAGRWSCRAPARRGGRPSGSWLAILAPRRSGRNAISRRRHRRAGPPSAPSVVVVVVRRDGGGGAWWS